MTAPDERIPATTAWAIALGALLGTVALTVHQPVTAAGALCGLALAVAVRWFAGSHRRVTVAAALVPAIALLGVAAVAVVADLPGVVLTIVGVAVGVATGLLAGGYPNPSIFERTGSASLSGAVVAGGVAVVALAADAAGGLWSATTTGLWLLGDGVVGLLAAILVAGIALVVGVIAVPPAMITVPARRLGYVRSRNALAFGFGIGTIGAIALVSVVAVVAWLVPLFGPVAAWLAGSLLVRVLLGAVTFVGLAVTGFSAAVRGSWTQTSERENAVVPALIGSVAGILVSALLVVGGSSLPAGTVGSLFGATAVVLGVGGFLAWVYAEDRRSDRPLEAALVVAIGLATGSVVVASTVDVTAGGLEAASGGLVTFVALAAALFTFDVGRYGRVLGREVGHTAASQRPQLVRIGWSGIVAAVGVPVAVLGLVAATVVTPTLSVPSTAGVVVGLCAVVVSAWLLSHQ